MVVVVVVVIRNIHQILLVSSNQGRDGSRRG